MPSSSRHHKSRRSRHEHVSSSAEWSEWSEWVWDAPLNKYYRTRMNAAGEYDYDYEYGNSNAASQPSTDYPSNSTPVPEISVEDSILLQDEEWSDTRTSRERGRRKSRENLDPEPYRAPTVSPSRPVGPGPQPPPFPPKPASSVSSYDSSAGCWSPTSTTSTIPTEYSNSSRTEEYAGGRRAMGSSQDYHGEDISITIKRKSFWATLSSSRDSFISAELVDALRLEKKSTNTCRYTDPDSRETYECRERIRTDIEPRGRAKLKDVKLYVIPRKSSLKNPVVLGTDSMGTLDPVGASLQDYSPSSIDSGYGTANSRPQFNLSLRTVDRTASSARTSSANYISPGYSSSLGYNQATYGQNLPSVQEVPSSPYTDSSYPKEAERTSYGASTSYYPTRDQSSHETYAESYPVDSERKQDSGFSSYNSAAHGTTGASGSADGGMGYNFQPGDDPNYSLHSDSHVGNSAYITPRPTPLGDESQNVYSSASDDSAYALAR